VALAGTLTAQAGGLYGYKEYKIPTDNSEPRFITTGSDGNLWFTEGREVFTPNPDPDTGGTFHSNIGRITPSGDIVEFAVDCGGCLLDEIVQGPDALYFTNNDFGSLGRITTDGAVSFVRPTDAQGNPFNYILGGSIASHGNDLWGSNSLPRAVIWRYNVVTETFTEYAVANAGDVAVADDGNVWFTAPGAIGTLDPSSDPSTPTVTTTATPGARPTRTAIASDGKVWFTSRIDDKVGYVDPANGNAVSVFPTLAPDTGPQDIAAAPDGSMWFSQAEVGNVANITPSGVIIEAGRAKPEIGGLEDAFGVAFRSDPDGPEGREAASVWFAKQEAGKIGRITEK
jgi:virginiamycin B lyase